MNQENEELQDLSSDGDVNAATESSNPPLSQTFTTQIESSTPPPPPPSEPPLIPAADNQTFKDAPDADVPETQKASIAEKIKNKFSSLSMKQKRNVGIVAAIVLVLAVIGVLFATHVFCFHDWQPATCTRPETCVTCGRTEGAASGHDWAEATCTEPKTCKRCGETFGSPLGHKVSEWIVDEVSTCTTAGKQHGVCSVCNETVATKLLLAEHTPGDWEVTKEATETSKGERTRKCTVCEKTLQTEQYSMSSEEIRARFIQSCQTYDYRDLARNATSLKGNRITARGKVIQVLREGNLYAMRVNVTQGSYGIWDDTVYVTYYKDSSAPNIIEDDIISFYGEIEGTTTYKSVLGASITLPDIAAQYIDIE